MQEEDYGSSERCWIGWSPSAVWKLRMAQRHLVGAASARTGRVCQRKRLGPCRYRVCTQLHFDKFWQKTRMFFQSSLTTTHLFVLLEFCEPFGEASKSAFHGFSWLSIRQFCQQCKHWIDLKEEYNWFHYFGTHWTPRACLWLLVFQYSLLVLEVAGPVPRAKKPRPCVGWRGLMETCGDPVLLKQLCGTLWHKMP